MMDCGDGGELTELDPSCYVLHGYLYVKSWRAADINASFGSDSFRMIANRLHSWREAYCTLDIYTSCFKYYKMKRRDDTPDLDGLVPQLSVMVNESDVIDVTVSKHGKEYNFIINLTGKNQILLSAETEMEKQKWLFALQNIDDIRDCTVLAEVNTPEKVFASKMKKTRSCAPKRFNRLPSVNNHQAVEIEDEEEKKLAQLAIACLEDSDDEDGASSDSDKEQESNIFLEEK